MVKPIDGWSTATPPIPPQKKARTSMQRYERLQDIPKAEHYAIIEDGTYVEHDYHGGGASSRPMILYYATKDYDEWLNGIEERTLMNRTFRAFVHKPAIVTTTVEVKVDA